MATYFGGSWFSTHADGECPAGRAPGDGKLPRCSWQLVRARTVACASTTLPSLAPWPVPGAPNPAKTRAVGFSYV